jgi:hypothetical protein
MWYNLDKKIEIKQIELNYNNEFSETAIKLPDSTYNTNLVNTIKPTTQRCSG